MKEQNSINHTSSSFPPESQDDKWIWFHHKSQGPDLILVELDCGTHTYYENPYTETYVYTEFWKPKVFFCLVQQEFFKINS